MFQVNAIRKFLVGAAMVCALVSPSLGWEGNESIMYWQITDTGNTVDDGPDDVYTFLGYDHANDDLGVRIAAYDSGGNLIKYLNPVYPDTPDYPGGIDWEYNDQPIGTRDDFWMTRASQAYYGMSDYAEVLFQMQLGNYDEDWNFNPLLYSRKELVSEQHWYTEGSLMPPGTDWIPTQFYTYNPVAPESSTSILILLGVATLAFTPLISRQ